MKKNNSYDLPYVVIFTTNEGSDIDKAMGNAFGSHYIRNEGYASEMTDRTYKKLAQQVYENLEGQGLRRCEGEDCSCLAGGERVL